MYEFKSTYHKYAAILPHDKDTPNDGGGTYSLLVGHTIEIKSLHHYTHNHKRLLAICNSTLRPVAPRRQAHPLSPTMSRRQLTGRLPRRSSEMFWSLTWMTAPPDWPAAPSRVSLIGCDKRLEMRRIDLVCPGSQ